MLWTLNLSHWGRVAHICVGDLTRSAPSHYLNQCWNTVDLAFRNKRQWKLDRNSYVFIHGNAFESVRLQNGSHFGLASMCNERRLHPYLVREAENNVDTHEMLIHLVIKTYKNIQHIPLPLKYTRWHTFKSRLLHSNVSWFLILFYS